MFTTVRPYLLLIGFALSTHLLKAQETTSEPSNKNYIGIRASSADAAINHSISYKRFLSASIAIEGLFTFIDPLAVGVLVEKFRPLATSIQWFYGAGAYAGFRGDRKFGAQSVLGLDFTAPTLPINLSLDWKPELNFTKQFSFEPAAVGLSARYIF